MCKNYTELRFTHFIVDREDGTVFGSARQESRVYNFLISSADGSVRAQNNDDWFELDPDAADIIRGIAHNAYGTVPTYRTDRLLLN